MKKSKFSAILMWLLVLTLLTPVLFIIWFLMWTQRIWFPPNSYLARQYIYRVAANDYDGALRLARGHKNCEEYLSEDIKKHIELYGGKQILDVKIELPEVQGSDDEISLPIITFQYADQGEEQWRSGKITLLTDYKGDTLRYVCESLDFHGP